MSKTWISVSRRCLCRQRLFRLRRDGSRTATRPAALLILGMLLFTLPAVQTSAQMQGPVLKKVAREVLPNGFELFVIEDHSMPLVTLSFAVRCGAAVQGKDTAGLPLLLERMILQGGADSPDSLQPLMWQSSTTDEYMGFSMTLPSERLAEAMEYWTEVLGRPRFDGEALVAVKAAVLAEMETLREEPGVVAEAALDRVMAPGFPWRKSSLGPAEVAAEATVDDLRVLHAATFIPSSMALIVSGDIRPMQVSVHAYRNLADWPLPASGTAAQIVPPFATPADGRGSDPSSGSAGSAGSTGPCPGAMLLDDPLFHLGVAQAQFRWSGPDTGSSMADTRTADVLLALLAPFEGRFKRSLMENVPGLFSGEYIDFGYTTASIGGSFNFSAYLSLGEAKGGSGLLDRVDTMRQLISREFAVIASNPSGYFGNGALTQATLRLLEQGVQSRDNVHLHATDILPFWWAVAGGDYFMSYEDASGAVSWDDIGSLVARYLVKKTEGSDPAARPSPAGVRREATLVRLRLDDADLAEAAGRLGYCEVDASNAFWWQQP